ncbi:hypothetical protein ANN_02631 [Periplaneta americana]|uniref:Uncharacterized protein n=1 Tax=Periplaneta americana TaxID=6978 RepID=A0ABQ8U0D2_PERAM|nr:hypothetical protein ANN_02631 [Periplaneta americana]
MIKFDHGCQVEKTKLAARFDVLDGIEDEMMYLEHANHCGNKRIGVIVEGHSWCDRKKEEGKSLRRLRKTLWIVDCGNRNSRDARRIDFVDCVIKLHVVPQLELQGLPARFDSLTLTVCISFSYSGAVSRRR